MKVIGCGNPDRGDDQAGLLVSERVREQGVQAEIHLGDPLSLLERWRSDDDVILVDAMMTGAPVGTVRTWDDRLPRLPERLAVSSHGFDIGKAIELAQTLERLPRTLRIYGIEGRQFERGAKISSEVGRAIETLARQIAAETLTHPKI